MMTRATYTAAIFVYRRRAVLWQWKARAAGLRDVGGGVCDLLIFDFRRDRHIPRKLFRSGI